MIFEIGNTRCKWLKGDILYFSSYNALDLIQKTLLDVPSNQTVYYSSVSNSRLELLKNLIPNNTFEFVNVRSYIDGSYILNNEDCIHIGSDRLFGVLGARNHTNNTIVSIDFGTATTINCFTKDTVFKGGMIFPGYMTQKNSIFSKTAILSERHITDNDLLQVKTAEAIHSGIVTNTCGAIKLVIDEIRQQSNEIPTIVLTGGNYHYFSQRLLTMGIKHIFDPFLVMRGIVSVMPTIEQRQYHVKR